MRHTVGAKTMRRKENISGSKCENVLPLPDMRNNPRIMRRHENMSNR